MFYLYILKCLFQNRFTLDIKDFIRLHGTGRAGLGRAGLGQVALLSSLVSRFFDSTLSLGRGLHSPLLTGETGVQSEGTNEQLLNLKLHHVVALVSLFCTAG